MAADTQANWGAAIRGVSVQFREFFNQDKDNYNPSWEPVVKTIGDNAAQATFSGSTGIGLPLRFAEGASIPKASRFKLYDTTFAHEQYGKQIEVTRKMLMNRDWGEAFNEFTRLTRGAQALKSKAPAQIFNRGFTSGTGVTNGVKVVTYNDGKPLFSTVHPRVDGGSSQSNASSTGITLTDANFETGRVALIEQLQDDGTPMQFTGDVYLVVSPALEKTAKIITGSTLKSGTANNDINIYNGGGYPVMVSNWLGAANGGTDTQWFLVAANHTPLQMIMRSDMELAQSIDKNTKSVLFDLILDFSVGSKDWRGGWGSKGDGVAYSS